jgi:quinoprotein glucose dehydrogenase
MKMNVTRFLVLGFLFLIFQTCKEEIEPLYPTKVISLQEDQAAELASKIRKEVAAEVAEGLDLSLWAVDSLVSDPIAISIDPQGRVFYTSATRQSNSEFDIRGHRNWITASVSFQTVEDRRAFLRETFSETNEEGERSLKDLNEDGVLDWRDLTVEKEQVWFVEDASGDGIADRAQLYLEDFHEEITDVANGVEYHDGEVFISVAPDMWRTKDRDNDGIADEKQSISHGYAVHIGFSGHGMSGAKIGPDGRIWWGIGDIGMNVVDKEGKHWKYPNRGVIVRSELDGSGFEVYAAGVRNTHEFVFDQYGNLITEDNDGDHRGERERLVYLINGSDSGWRTNWQYGKYTDPDNNDYKVWMDERLHVPRWEGQAAYILPPIANYVNGPTGMVYNPGTALGPEWYDHFFIVEFRGSPANSPLHAFTLTPKGASFELATTQEVVKGILPTGLDFGPDGALYFSDWIEGWGTKDAGRIWKLDVPGGAASPVRRETRQLIEADFSKNSEEELSNLLAHRDMRVRQKAQFELAKRGRNGYEALLAVAQQSTHQLARIHALWGLGQLSRKNIDYAEVFIPFLQDDDPEIIAQAAKMLGDVRYSEAGEALLPLVQHELPRVRLLTTEALGRMACKNAVQPIIQMLRANNDEDAWLRHAGAIALARIGEEDPLAALHTDDSRAVRTAAVIALRRMSSPHVAAFLHDADEYVVTEAARAINDDFSIEAALPDLARVLSEERFTGEPLLRRAINANLRVGEKENIDLLVAYATRSSAPAAMRAEALAALSTWPKPSVFDRVDGRYRGEITREATPVVETLQPILNDLLNDPQPAVQTAAAEAAARLELSEAAPTLLAMVKNAPDGQVRQAALKALHGLKAASLTEALQIAIADEDNEVRSAAVEILPESGIAEGDAVQLFQRIIQAGTIEEQQAAFSSLGAYRGEEAVQTLEEALNQLTLGRQPPDIQLDIIEAVEKQGDPNLMEKLEAYQAAKPKGDPLALYRETLAGGNFRRGWRIFNNHEAAQCVRCHAIFERGGNVGPTLAGVGDRLSNEEILESLVQPSATLAPGYGIVILEMEDGESVSGTVLEETETQLRLRIAKEDIRTLEKSRIANRENIPSSMPPVGDILTKREIRDLVAFLGRLREENF